MKQKIVDLKLPLIIAAVIIVAIVAIVFGLRIGVGNHLVTLEESINNAQSGIDAQQKRRADLLPNLVDVVQHYADFEHDTQLDTIAARGQNQQITDAGDGKNSSEALQIYAVAEAYPDLKANEQYRELMNELSATENLIFQYRDNYNAQVREYRTYSRKWPATMVISWIGYEVQDFDYLEFDNAPVDAPTNLFKAPTNRPND